MIEIGDIQELDDQFVIHRKLVAMMADHYDNLIMDEIIKTAKEEGITDLCILNKQFVYVNHLKQRRMK